MARELETGIHAGTKYAHKLMKLQIAMDTVLTSIQNTHLLICRSHWIPIAHLK